MSEKKSGSKSARMRSARLHAVQAVYEMLISKKDYKELILEFIEHRFDKPVDDEHLVSPDKALFSSVVRGVHDRYEDLSVMVQNSAITKDSTSRNIEPLLGSILLCGSFELLSNHETDSAIIINDYIDIGHAFYDQGEAKLVNAVLDRIKGNVRV
jgi:N utilization substance protein B